MVATSRRRLLALCLGAMLVRAGGGARGEEAAPGALSEYKIKAAYLYYFTHEPPTEPGTPNLRATHTAEIPYVFNNLKAVRVFPDTSSPELSSASAADIKLADIVSSYFVNFARTGNPNGKGLAPWPAYRDKATGRAMILGDTQQAMDEHTTDTAKWDLYDQLYAKQQPAK